MGVLFDDAPQPIEAAPETPGQFQKGMRAGFLGAGSQLQGLAGGVAEAAGYKDFAKNRYADMRDLQGQADAAGPRIGRIGEVTNLRDAYDYTTGLLGGSMPQSLAALGAGGVVAATGGGAIPAMLAAGAALTPFETGDVIQRQQNDPVSLRTGAGERLGQAAGSGALSSAFQSVVPGGVAMKLAGKTVAGAAKRTAGQILADVPKAMVVEGISEGAGEAAKQGGLMLSNPNKAFNYEDIAENAIGGAVAGGALGGLGAGVDLARKGAKAAISAPGAAIDAAKEALPSAEDAAGTIRKAYEDSKTNTKEFIDRVAAGEDVADLGKIKGLGAEAIAPIMGMLDSERAQRMKAQADELLSDAGLTPERRAEIADAAANIADKGKQQIIAGYAKAKQAATSFAQDAKKWVNSFKNAPKGSVQDDTKLLGNDTKRSDDFSGIEPAILREITGVLKEKRPELFERGGEAALRDAGRGIAKMFQMVSRGGKDALTSDNIMGMLDTFGNDAFMILDSVYKAVGSSDPAEIDKLYGALNAARDAKASRDGLLATMKENLIDPNMADDATLKTVAEALRQHVLGQTDRNATPVSAQQARFKDAEVQNELTKFFGPKAAAVRTAVENDVREQQKANPLKRIQSDAEQDLRDPMTKMQERKSSDLMDTTEYGRMRIDDTTGETLYDGLEHIDTLNNPKSQAAQALTRAEKENPTKNVEFVLAKDLPETYSGTKALVANLREDLIAANPDISEEDIARHTKEALATHGLVLAEGTKSETDISKRALSKVMLKREDGETPSSWYKNPARFDAGGKVFDAIKLTEYMHDKQKNNWTDADNKTRPHRAARMFMDGIASLQNTLGEAFDVPDSTVITKGGMTYGEAKKLDFTPKPDKETERAQQLFSALREKYKETKAAGGDTSKLVQEMSNIKDALIALDHPDFRKTTDGIGVHGKDYDANRTSEIKDLAKRIAAMEREINSPIRNGQGTAAKADLAKLREIQGFMQKKLERLVRADEASVGGTKDTTQREADPFGPLFQATRGNDDDTGIKIESSGNPRGSEVKERDFGKADNKKGVAARLRNSEIDRLREKFESLKDSAQSAAGKSIARKGLELLSITNNMNDSAHKQLSKLLGSTQNAPVGGEKPPSGGARMSDVASVVNALSEKYSAQIVAARAADSYTGKAEAAPEVAAKRPKADGVVGSRIGDQIAFKENPKATELYSQLMPGVRAAISQGVNPLTALEDARQKAMATTHDAETKRRVLAVIETTVDQLIAYADEHVMNAELFTALNGYSPTAKTVPYGTPVKPPAITVRKAMDIIIKHADPLTQVLARAIKSVAPDTPISLSNSMTGGMLGSFDVVSGNINIAWGASSKAAATIIHEGAHAATLKALSTNPKLEQAFFDLLTHVTDINPNISHAYGATNVGEFIAEGFGNPKFREALQRIPANDKVAKYLGQNIANAWHAFTELVRQALGIDAKHSNAMTQLFELSGMAMHEVHNTGGVTQIAADYIQRIDRRVVDPKEVARLRDAIAHEAGFIRGGLMKLVFDRVFPKNGSATVSQVAALEAILHTVKQPGELNGTNLIDVINWASKTGEARAGEMLTDGMNPFPSMEKAQSDYSMTVASTTADVIHRTLEKRGFAATHDSPIKHEGKFDWRAHKGKGEGNAAFGAGTYLSSADGVHRNYKDMFTAKVNEDDDGTYAELSNEVRRASAELDNAILELKSAKKAREAKGWRELSYKGVFEPSDGASIGFVVEKDGEWGDGYIAVHGEHGVPLGEPKKSLQEVLDAMLTGDEIGPYKDAVESAQKTFDLAMEDLTKHGEPVKSPTYEVSVDIKPEELLDWNKPFGEQSEFVQKALEKFGVVKSLPESWLDDGQGNIMTSNHAGDYTEIRLHNGKFELTHNDKLIGGFDSIREAKDAAKQFDDLPTGSDIYKILTNKLGSQRKASEALQAAGILGHKYASVGGKNDTHPNYVIYDDSKIETNYVHFDKQPVDPTAGGHSAADRKATRDYINDVLGPAVKVVFKNILHAGEATRVGADDIIRISVHALNPLSTGFHEAMHVFFRKLADQGNAEVSRILERVAMTAPIQNQLKTLLAGKPDALAQLKDPEEAAAYMYQFWASKDLNVGPDTTTFFGKIAKMIRDVLGIWSNDERALAILEYFHDGEFKANMNNPSAVADSLVAAGRNKAIEKAKSFTKPLSDMYEAMATAGGQRLRDTGIPALGEIADLMKLPVGAEGSDPGFISAARTQKTRYMNMLAKQLQGYTQAQLDDALEAMQNGTRATTPEGRLAQRIVQGPGGLLPTMLTYMTRKGVDTTGLQIDHAYFPRVWNSSYIAAHKAEFLNMLDKYVQSGELKGSPIELMNRLMAIEGNEFTTEVDRPGMTHLKKRLLAFIEPADAAPFMRKDLYEILNSYVTQATRRAEWAERMGDEGEKIGALLAKAKKQGATKADIDATWKYVRAVDGTLGDTINPEWRRLQGNLIVYQNIRLLPLAIFSSIVDPLGIMVRGGTISDSFDAFKRGVSEVKLNFVKERGPKDAATAFAELVGTIDDAMLTSAIGAVYSQGMVGDTGRKINDTFFRFNLMEQFNRSMRVGATQAAVKFLARHADGTASKHSERWMRELGYEPGEYDPTVLDAKARAAINRWVDGAVLRPDAADKPIWMSDPHYALFAHLKQFVFSFQETILKRVMHEMDHGNFAPAMAMASYVPVMIAADMVKGMVQGGGDTPEWKKGWTASDYVWSGMTRAGLFGVGQFGLDAQTDLQRGGTGFGALTGPTITQLIGAAQVVGGNKEAVPFALKSMPANALYSGFVTGGSKDESVTNR